MLGPVRVAIVNDYEIVVAGLAAALEQFPDRVRIVELDLSTSVRGDVDVVLFDTFGQTCEDGCRLVDLVADGGSRVVVFSWHTEPDLVERALAHGAAGYVSKHLDAADLVRAIERVVAGQVERAVGSTPDEEPEQTRGHVTWPGREYGLSGREAEVVALITQGLSNQEIAELTSLSVNSIKTYIRTAYRKIGADSRAQAVIWGLTHGLEPSRSRTVHTESEPPRA